MKNNTIIREKSSFRDNSGFLFFKNDQLYRQVNNTYKEHYDLLMQSGLYDELMNQESIIPHEEVEIENHNDPNVYRIIKPENVPFISYPYEWCFSQLKIAALTTLSIQKIALNYGMILKDASAYNIQFKNNAALLIDTLSFEKYVEGEPWVAYKQYCQHFLGPLALMSYCDVRLNNILKSFIDGIPLDMVSNILPKRTLLKPSILIHIHLHAKSQKHLTHKPKIKQNNLSKLSFTALIDSLESAVKKLSWEPNNKVWADYYSNIHYKDTSFEDKINIVTEYIRQINPKRIWDMGANTGLFSRIASKQGITTISLDNDPTLVEINYKEAKKNDDQYIHPLIMEVTNPSPAIGWENQERMSFNQRSQDDTVLALALIHHIIIANNVPLSRLPIFFKRLCKHLIIEFMPKDDPKVQQLLSTREDIFDDYSQTHFEQVFSEHFNINTTRKIKDSNRILYLMKRKNHQSS